MKRINIPANIEEKFEEIDTYKKRQPFLEFHYVDNEFQNELQILMKLDDENPIIPYSFKSFAMVPKWDLGNPRETLVNTLESCIKALKQEIEEYEKETPKLEYV
jgi:hypothetical protein